MTKKYYDVRKKYLADALSYLGFKYFKDGFKENTIYSFEDTELFRTAMTELNNLKNKLSIKS